MVKSRIVLYKQNTVNDTSLYIMQQKKLDWEKGVKLLYNYMVELSKLRKYGIEQSRIRFGVVTWWYLCQFSDFFHVGHSRYILFGGIDPPINQAQIWNHVFTSDQIFLPILGSLG